MKPIVLTLHKWSTIRSILHKEYPPSTFMIRDKMRSRLGFTVREHQEWISDPKAYTEEPTALSNLIDFEQEGWYKGKRHENTIRLDFYSENKRTMFLLKFSELI